MIRQSAVAKKFCAAVVAQERAVLCQTAPAQRATPNPTGAPSSTGPAAPTYTRHAPERTLLYALVQAHYPNFVARLAAQDRPLPANVRDAFEAYLRCGVLEHGFLRVVCEHWGSLRDPVMA